MSGPVQSAPAPAHVAVIMDGNGRWAKQRGLPRLRGHEEGAESVRAVLRACREAGVHTLTLYAFSMENWKRSETEVSGLMTLLGRFLRDREDELHEQQVRLRAEGRLELLPRAVRRELERVMESTAGHTAGQLILALSYGGRAELVDAFRAMARKVRAGELDPETIDEEAVRRHLYLPDVPDPDLLIRTSGELRVSNFLLWQISYAELYVTEVLWPDFREAEFRQALAAYAARQRRYGNA